MRHLTSPVRRLAVAAVALSSTALALTACGGDSADSGGSGSGSSAGGASSSPLPSVTADQALADRVPDAIASDGTIAVGSDTTYAPAEFIGEDGSTVVGFDVDLFTLVAAKLGLKAQFETAPFDSIIAGVGSGKYEVGVSSFTISAERLAQANMVSYYNAGTQWSVKKGNPQDVDPDNACGLKIAVQKATVQVDDITARSEACTAAGDPEITIDQYEGQDEATAAVVSGKDDAGLADLPVMVYAVQQTNGQLELLGDPYGDAPYGYVVPTDQAEFAQVLADAVSALIADGSYQQALEKWGVEGGAISDPTVNPTVG
ncbi:ABC transporter substrate-binding protein [Modestobacter excelsi]|uniref:ABC transporter substrate-binding protein n=1 Tax=Modestobacter excelsi TaxID=2213161 RepID=UPI001C20DE8C|nr:ABC transporter substrate-binding protein [Modestobacter excelsi]